MSYIYDKSGQNVYFQRESDTYGHIYDPEDDVGIVTWEAIPADYPHWRKLDYIVDTFDPVLPLIEKLKQFDVSDGKHASAIASGNIKPIEFTLNMDAQGLEFLALAIGAPAFGSAGRKVIQTITCINETDGVTEDDYFLLDVTTAANLIKHYLIWFNDGTGTAPVVTGINNSNRVEIDISGGDKSANDIALLLETALELLTEITAVTVSGADAEITTVVTAGAVQQARNGAASPGFSYSMATAGSTTYTLTEALTTDLPSFVIHLEQANQTSAEDIVWDLFGCVVESVAVNVAFSDSIVKYSVTFKCPYALENSNGIATNPPPKKIIPSMSSMDSLQEATDAVLIQEGSTATVNGAGDRTPQQVEKVSLDIKNNIVFYPDIEKRYMVKACAGKRDVTMNVVGLTTEKELFNYWQGAYTESGGDYYPTGADKINTTFKLQRDATYDYISIHIYSWLLSEHNFSFVNVEDAVKKVDMTFVDGVGDSNGRMLDSNTFVILVDRTVMVEDALA